MKRIFNLLRPMALALVPFCSLALHSQAPVNDPMSAARQFLSEGKPDLAIAEYKKAVASDPSNLEAQGNLGVLQFFANDCIQSIPHLSAALPADAASGRIRALLGICQKRAGQVDEAMRNLTSALPLVTNPKIHALIESSLADLYYSHGDLQQASVAVAELSKIEPANPDTLYVSYRIYADMAESSRNALILAAPDSARAHQMTAERFINSGQAALAVRQFQEAVAIDSNLPGLHYELGEAILQESTSPDSRKRAEAELKIALQQDSRNAGAESKLGTIAVLDGDTRSAQAHFTRALELNENEFNALVGLGDILRAQSQNEKALPYYVRASKVDPMDDALHFRLAQIYRELGRKTEEQTEMKLFVKVRDLRSRQNVSDQQRTATQAH